jgi:hypothetical protein
MSILGDYPFIRKLSSPLSEKMLSRLDEKCRVVQFDSPLKDSEYRRVADFLGDYPKVSLRVYGGINPMENLDFLRFLPGIRNFQADLWNLKSLKGLEHLPRDLTFLGLGATKSKALSLRVLERFDCIQELYLEGHVKDIDVLRSLTSMQKLTLRSITLPDISLLKPLINLWSLDMKLGGTKDISLLPEIGHLKYLELWMIKGLCDLNAIAEVAPLQYLFLQALPNVRAMPAMKKLANLRRIHIETMKGLYDLSPLLDAPALEELVVIDAGHMKVEDFLCLKNHPSLKRFSAGLGSIRKNEKARALLNLPGTSSLKNGFIFR